MEICRCWCCENVSSMILCTLRMPHMLGTICHHHFLEFIPLTLSDANAKHFYLLRLFSFFDFIFNCILLGASVVLLHHLTLDFFDWLIDYVATSTFSYALIGTCSLLLNEDIIRIQHHRTWSTIMSFPASMHWLWRRRRSRFVVYGGVFSRSVGKMWWIWR